MNQDEEKKIWGFIYKFRISEKDYIGKTISLKKRLKYHLYEKKINKYFHNSLRKYFQPKCFCIIEAHYDVSKNLQKILNEQEMFWIKKLDTFDLKQEKGWNLTKGGEGNLGRIPTEETRKKMRENHWDSSGENNYWYGKNHSGENNPMYGKKGKNNPLFGRKRPDVSERMKNRIGEKNPNFGKKNLQFAERSKQRTGEKNNKSKPVILISPNGVEHKLSSSFSFCRQHNLDAGNICAMLKGRIKQHKGWTGRYINAN